MGDTTKRSQGLSIVTAITFAVGTMVGAGIFVLSGLVVAAAGPSALYSYLICAIIVSFSGLSYAALASIFPEDGGGYLYAEKILGKYPGFLTGWAMYISQPIVISFVLLGFGIYLNLLLGISFDPRIWAAIALILLTLLNTKGISEAGKFEVMVVFAKVAILVVLSVVALTQFQPVSFSPLFPNGLGGFAQGITMVFFAFMGFQVITMLGGEVKKSSRNVPLAILASIILVTILYAGVVIALITAGLPSYGSESLFDAAEVFLGIYGGAILAFGAVLSTLSSANALNAGASRIVMEMASEKQVPGRFAKLNNGQPSNALFLGAVISMIFIIVGNLDFILNLVNVAMLISMFFVNLSAAMLFRRRERIPTTKSRFKIPLGPTIPIIGAISCAIMMLTTSIDSIVLGLIALFLGTILYSLEDTDEGRKEVEKIREALGRSI